MRGRYACGSDSIASVTHSLAKKTLGSTRTGRAMRCLRQARGEKVAKLHRWSSVLVTMTSGAAVRTRSVPAHDALARHSPSWQCAGEGAGWTWCGGWMGLEKSVGWDGRCEMRRCCWGRDGADERRGVNGGRDGDEQRSTLDSDGGDGDERGESGGEQARCSSGV